MAREWSEAWDVLGVRVGCPHCGAIVMTPLEKLLRPWNLPPDCPSCERRVGVPPFFGPRWFNVATVVSAAALLFLIRGGYLQSLPTTRWFDPELAAICTWAGSFFLGGTVFALREPLAPRD